MLLRMESCLRVWMSTITSLLPRCMPFFRLTPIFIHTYFIQRIHTCLKIHVRKCTFLCTALKCIISYHNTSQLCMYVCMYEILMYVCMYIESVFLCVGANRGISPPPAHGDAADTQTCATLPRQVRHPRHGAKYAGRSVQRYAGG